jgi:DNA polymerase V
MSTWGGIRKGAGRKAIYACPTKVMRIPENMISQVKEMIKNNFTEHYALPLYSSRVAAGFPTPADDLVETTLNLNDYLIKQPSATFFVRAAGDSMKDVGIHDGDLLIVDRSIPAAHGKIVIAAIYGELTVKRLMRKNNKLYLMPENDKYQPIEVREEGGDMKVWGVVTNVIHKL